MSVKRAAQVLSHTVAAGLNTHVGPGDLPAEAIYTSEFCERMDTLLFNSFNSSSLTAGRHMGSLAMRQHDRSQNKSQFSCNHCNYSGGTQRALRMHLNKYHDKRANQPPGRNREEVRPESQREK